MSEVTFDTSFCQVWGCRNIGAEQTDGVWYCARHIDEHNNPTKYPILCNWGWPDDPEPECRKPAQGEVITVFCNGYWCTGSTPAEVEHNVSYHLRLCQEHLEMQMHGDGTVLTGGNLPVRLKLQDADRLLRAGQALKALAGRDRAVEMADAIYAKIRTILSRECTSDEHRCAAALALAYALDGLLGDKE